MSAPDALTPAWLLVEDSLGLGFQDRGYTLQARVQTLARRLVVEASD